MPHTSCTLPSPSLAWWRECDRNIPTLGTHAYCAGADHSCRCLPYGDQRNALIWSTIGREREGGSLRNGVGVKCVHFRYNGHAEFYRRGRGRGIFTYLSTNGGPMLQCRLWRAIGSLIPSGVTFIPQSTLSMRPGGTGMHVSFNFHLP